MSNDLIYGTIYTEFDDKIGPNPILWEPSDISKHIRKLVSMKTITLLAGEEDFIPKKLLLIPFPSINMKALIKYINWEDKSRRAGEAWASITLLFNEFDDLIFYKYKDDLKPIFEEISVKIANSEDLRVNKGKFAIEFNGFYNKIIKTLEDLRKKEFSSEKLGAFPEGEDRLAEKTDFLFKIIVCGDPGVGKTSIILRFTDNAFTRTYLPTIGVNVTEKCIKIDDQLVEFVIWDIAGQIKFQTVRKHFYKGAKGIFLIFDLTYEKSFNNITKWYEDLKKNVKKFKNISGFILGNKKDLVDQREISKEKAFILAKKLNFKYFETSALTGENVNDSFYRIAERLILKLKN